MKLAPEKDSHSTTPREELPSAEEAEGISQISRREILWASFPSFLLGFGYLLFYSQILFRWWRPQGTSAAVLTTTSLVCLGAGLVIAGFLLIRLARRFIAEMHSSALVHYALLATLVALLLVSLFSASKPAHLIQERDFANYHLTIPKQNWLWGDWRSSGWNGGAFVSLLLEFGYSPFWVGAQMVNKLPQFLLFVFLLIKVWMGFPLLRVARPYLSGLLAVISLFAFRGIEIQVGMAMLDLPALYFLASLSLLALILPRTSGGRRRKLGWLLSLGAGLDVCGLIGYKSFAFIFFVPLLIAAEILLRKLFQISLVRPARGRLRLVPLTLPLIVILLPNLGRTFYFTGDPVYPVFPPLTREFCHSSHLRNLSCSDIRLESLRFRRALTNYGYGHGPVDLAKAFLLLPLAWGGHSRVTNKFDYPLGIFWFATWGLLLWAIFLSRDRSTRRPALFAGGLAALLFCIWFAGSQQSRWLYPALFFLALFWAYAIGGGTALPDAMGRFKISKRHIRTLLIALTCLAAAANGARIIRSQRHTLSCFGKACLASNPRYIRDYETQCGSSPLLISNPKDRGYLNCRVEWTIGGLSQPAPEGKKQYDKTGLAGATRTFLRSAFKWGLGSPPATELSFRFRSLQPSSRSLLRWGLGNRRREILARYQESKIP